MNSAQLKEKLIPYLMGKDLWMIQIEPGWIDIIDDLHNHIANIYPDYRIIQVKEKFAELRYYCTYPSDPDKQDHIRQLISIAQRASSKICQECGDKAELRTVGYTYITLCDKHHEERLHKKS